MDQYLTVAGGVAHSLDQWPAESPHHVYVVQCPGSVDTLYLLVALHPRSSSIRVWCWVHVLLVPTYCMCWWYCMSGMLYTLPVRMCSSTSRCLVHMLGHLCPVLLLVA